MSEGEQNQRMKVSSMQRAKRGRWKLLVIQCYRRESHRSGNRSRCTWELERSLYLEELGDDAAGTTDDDQRSLEHLDRLGTSRVFHWRYFAKKKNNII